MNELALSCVSAFASLNQDSNNHDSFKNAFSIELNVNSKIQRLINTLNELSLPSTNKNVLLFSKNSDVFYTVIKLAEIIKSQKEFSIYQSTKVISCPIKETYTEGELKLEIEKKHRVLAILLSVNELISSKDCPVQTLDTTNYSNFINKNSSLTVPTSRRKDKCFKKLKRKIQESVSTVEHFSKCPRMQSDDLNIVNDDSDSKETITF